MNEIKKSHLILKDHHKEIKSWLTKHNAVGKQCKEEVSAIFEKLTKFCVLVEAKTEENFDSDGPPPPLDKSQTMRDVSQNNMS